MLAMSPLGDKLKKERRRRGLTQIELAEAAGMSPGALNRIETGHVPERA